MSIEKQKVTPFRLRVYNAVRRIPVGKVLSYAALASTIDCRSARVVGQALRMCPYEDVPCHRVVASGYKLGGFAGRSEGPEVRRKRNLLEAEGIQFASNGRIQPSFVLRDSPGLRRLIGGDA